MFKPKHQNTNISICSEYLIKILKRKSVVFFISDFLDKNYSKPMKILNQKHDLINIKILDKFEYQLHEIGMIKLRDNETNDEIWVDLNVDANNNYINTNSFDLFCKKNKIDLIKVLDVDNYIKPLIDFFKKRTKSI